MYRKSKYNVGNKEGRTCNGITFDSKAEMTRYTELLLLQKAGAISDLKLQTPFELIKTFKYKGKTIRGSKYYADFTYYENGVYVVEDVKGVKTALYQNKKKQLLSKYPDIDFRETGAAK
jgi:hypothetical protein